MEKESVQIVDFTVTPSDGSFSWWNKVEVEDGIPKFVFRTESEILEVLGLREKIIKTSIFHQLATYIGYGKWIEVGDIDDLDRYLKPSAKDFDKLKSIKKMLNELTVLVDRQLDTQV